MQVIEINERDHSRGVHDAEITLLEYGDFQCPHCGTAYETVKRLERELGGSMRFVFRQFPLTGIHEFAEMAAEAAEAAAMQGKFWEMHDYLFENQDELSPALLKSAALELDLDRSRFTDEMDRRLYSEHVQHDVKTGVDVGVHGTPTFFINGVQHRGGRDFETLSRAIEEQRRQAAA